MQNFNVDRSIKIKLSIFTTTSIHESGQSKFIYFNEAHYLEIDIDMKVSTFMYRVHN